MMHKVTVLVSFSMLFAGSTALAQSEDGDAPVEPAVAGEESALETCVAALNENERLIYDELSPLFPTEDDPEDVVRERVRQMVRDDVLSRSQARGSVDAAVECVRLAGQEAASTRE